MGRNPSWLSEKQIGVLEWIRDGCPGTDDETDYGRRITARALHRRGLVAVRGAGAWWMAVITKAGRTWLEAHPRVTTEDGGGADDLLRRVLAADGRLSIGDIEGSKLAYEELIRSANQSPARPKGWRLEIKNVGSWHSPSHEIVLVRQFEDLVDAIPVPVPSHVTRYHPAVKAYLDDRGRQMVSREHLGRAARILQALADEAPRRGVEVLPSLPMARHPTSYEDRELSRGHLLLRSPAGSYAIRVQELSAPGGKAVERRPWRGRSTRAAWLESRTTEFVGTGELELIVEGPGMTYGGYRIRDSSTLPVEERLPRIFRRIEIHRLEDEVRMQEREREAAERRRRWETAMAEARARYTEQVRWDAFVHRSGDWEAVRRHREFLAAAREAVGSIDGPSRTEVLEQLAFAERRLDELDPLLHPDLVVPEIPDPGPDDLKPYLDGWSPHGPDRW